MARRRRRTCGGRWRRSFGGTRTGRSGGACRRRLAPGGWRRSCSSAGRISAFGSGCLNWLRSGAWNLAWCSSTAPPSERATKRQAPKKGADSAERDHREALGRSRGGFGTKAVVTADAAGRAIGFALAPGQAHELPLAPGLIETLPDIPLWVVGDRGFSADDFRALLWDIGTQPVIPPKRNEAQVKCPNFIYVHRNRIERLWNRLKEWRAVATRYEKTAASFLSILCLAATADWIKI